MGQSDRIFYVLGQRAPLQKFSGAVDSFWGRRKVLNHNFECATLIAEVPLFAKGKAQVGKQTLHKLRREVLENHFAVFELPRRLHRVISLVQIERVAHLLNVKLVLAVHGVERFQQPGQVLKDESELNRMTYLFVLEHFF